MSYETVVLADSPTLLWKLDETSGTAAADATGNGNTGTYNGGTLASGFLIGPNRNVRFDSGEYVESDSAIPVTDPFSLELWTEWDASTVTGLWARPLLFGFYDSPNDYFLIYYQASQGAGSTTLGSSLYADVAASLSDIASTAVTQSLFDRIHIVLTVSSTVATLYVNGVEVDSDTVDLSGFSSNHKLFVGSATSMFAGLAGMVALYPSALSAAQVAAHYAARDQNSSDDGTVVDAAYLSFDKADTDTATSTDTGALTVNYTGTDTAAGTDTAYPTKQYTSSDSATFHAYISGAVASTYQGSDRVVVSDSASCSNRLPGPGPVVAAQIRPTATSVTITPNTQVAVVTPVAVNATVAPNTAIAVVA